MPVYLAASPESGLRLFFSVQLDGSAYWELKIAILQVKQHVLKTDLYEYIPHYTIYTYTCLHDSDMKQSTALSLNAKVSQRVRNSSGNLYMLLSRSFRVLSGGQWSN
jgi:hypothetical protein